MKQAIIIWQKYHSLGVVLQGGSSAEPLAVEFFDELRQRRFPGFLLVIVNFAQLRRLHSQLAGHLRLGVRQVMALPRLIPCSRLLILFGLHWFRTASTLL